MVGLLAQTSCPSSKHMAQGRLDPSWGVTEGRAGDATVGACALAASESTLEPPPQPYDTVYAHCSQLKNSG